MPESSVRDCDAVIVGTGPGGRVTREDVQKIIDAGGQAPAPAAAPAASAPAGGSLPLRGMRKVIAERMHKARAEMSHWAEYDYLVVNEKFEQAVDDLTTIITARLLGHAAQRARHAELIEGLLRAGSTESLLGRKES